MSIPQVLEFIAQRDDVYPDLKIGPGGNVMVQDDGDGPFIAVWPEEYGEQPTAEELAAASTIAVLVQTVTNARITKYSTDVSAGLTYNGNTYSLTDSSLNNWQKLATSLRAEIAEGETDATDPVEIQTAAGELVEFPASECLSLLAKIGKTARLLQTRDLKWTGAIAQATTVEQLTGIQAMIEAA